MMGRASTVYRSLRRGGVAGVVRLLRDRLSTQPYDVYRFDLSEPLPAIPEPDHLHIEVGDLARLRAWVRTRTAAVPAPYLQTAGDPALSFCWALSETEPVGIIWMGVVSPLIRLGEGEAITKDSYTDPDWRGRGVGKALKAAACRHLKARGFKVVYTTVRTDNVASQRVQHALGFVRVGGFTSRGLFKTRPATTHWRPAGRETSAA